MYSKWNPHHRIQYYILDTICVQRIYNGNTNVPATRPFIFGYYSSNKSGCFSSFLLVNKICTTKTSERMHHCSVDGLASIKKHPLRFIAFHSANKNTLRKAKVIFNQSQQLIVSTTLLLSYLIDEDAHGGSCWGVVGVVCGNYYCSSGHFRFRCTRGAGTYENRIHFL